jgi:ParB-like chromosome segregation protein Spo0J
MNKKKKTMKEFHAISNIFPMMEGDDFDDLVADIKANGLLEPIWLHPDGRIIDGRNRYRACQEAGIEPQFQEWEPDGRSLATFVLSKNIHRRQLTSSQRAAIAVGLLPHLEEEAKSRMQLAAEGKEIIPDLQKGQARDHAAKITQSNPRYVGDAKKLDEQAPELLREVLQGKKTIPKAMKEYEKKKRTVDTAPEPTPTDPPDSSDGCKLYHADVGGTPEDGHDSSLPKVEDGSVDCIITEPPCSNDSNVFERLSIEAFRMLKDGGCCIVITEKKALPEAIPGLLAEDLKYHSMLACLMPEKESRRLRIKSQWKPALWFTKGKYDGPAVDDVIPHEPNGDTPRTDRIAAALVSRFTKPGDTVLDPFLGKGATAVAVLRNGRRFIGADANEDNIQNAEAKIRCLEKENDPRPNDQGDSPAEALPADSDNEPLSTGTAPHPGTEDPERAEEQDAKSIPMAPAVADPEQSNVVPVQKRMRKTI